MYDVGDDDDDGVPHSTSEHDGDDDDDDDDDDDNDEDDDNFHHDEHTLKNRKNEIAHKKAIPWPSPEFDQLKIKALDLNINLKVSKTCKYR